MTEQMPKDIPTRLRQLASAVSSGRYPSWFDTSSVAAWQKQFNGAADELEQMQQLNGRLLRRLAGD
jgi:hypothetical protein